MGALGNKLERLITERNKLSAELREVNAERFRLECRLDILTTRLCAAINLRLPGDVLSPPGPGRRKVL
jgi:hypothetical protein